MSAGWNGSSPTDAIKAPTLNLTKLTTYVAGGLGIITAFVGFLAEIITAEDPTQSAAVRDEDFVGFNDAQRLVILVALIAAIAVTYAADLFARAIASSRATSGQAHVFPSMHRAKKVVPNTNAVGGWVTAMRASDGAMLFHDVDNPSTPGEWVPPQHISFTG